MSPFHFPPLAPAIWTPAKGARLVAYGGSNANLPLNDPQSPP